MREHIYLYSRDTKGKIRVMYLNSTFDGEKYTIGKQTGLLTGKWTVQPDKEILKGKVKRTIHEQYELELNSLIKKQRDKGYKDLELDLGLPLEKARDEDALNEKLGIEKTTGSGNRKPMLAQEAIKQSEDWLTRAWWVSYKLDGVRSMAHIETDPDTGDKLVFKSRSGIPFQGVTTGIATDHQLIALARTYDCEIDGEFYKHGMPLNKINGACAKEEYDPERHDEIEFHIFDLANDTLTTQERATILNKLEEFDNPRIKIVRQIYAINTEAIDSILNKAVSEGYEGVMARTVGSKYQFGKRSRELLKFKPFLDDEFEIVSVIQGLRHIHDMVFELYTKDKSTTFKAKPEGDFELKKWYTDNADDLIGRMATIKYQRINEETGRPTIVTFKGLRDD